VHFGNETYLWPLGLAVLGLFLAAVFSFGRDRRDLRLLGHRNLVLSPALAILRRGLKGFLILSALGLCAMGAARWQGKAIPEESGQYGLDVMIALDVSKSMLTRDVSPNRLEAAKQGLLESLGSLDGDRVGLTAFAGEALVQVPLTLDFDALATVLQGEDVDAVEVGGTSFAKAIDTCLNAFPQDEPGKEPSKRGRIILLYTDGEPTRDEGALGAVLEEAKKDGVIVVCVGVGTPKGQPIPAGQNFWGEAEYKHDSSGQVVISRLDEETLSKIAGATGGVVVAGDNPQALSHVDRMLQKLDRTLITDKNAMKREELAPRAGVSAAVLLLTAAIL